MNQDADIRNDLKNIVQEHLGKASSALFLAKSLAIIDGSADNKESCIAAAVRICKRVALFIDKDLAQTVYEGLIVAIDKYSLPQGTKRRYTRVTFCKKVRVGWNGAHYELDSENLSEGGMYIKTENPFPAGVEIQVTLPLGFGSRIHLTGLVVYKNDPFGDTLGLPPGMAIEFQKIRDEEAEILRNYVRKALARDGLESQEETIVEPLSSY